MNTEEKIKIIKTLVSEYFEISVDKLLSKTRKSEIVKARNYCMLILRYELGLTFNEIGKVLNKECSTLIRNYQTITNEISINKRCQEEIKDLKSIVKNSIKYV